MEDQDGIEGRRGERENESRATCSKAKTIKEPMHAKQ